MASGPLASVCNPRRRITIEDNTFDGQLDQLPLPTFARLFLCVYFDFFGPRGCGYPAAAFPLTDRRNEGWWKWISSRQSNLIPSSPLISHTSSSLRPGPGDPGPPW